MSDVETISSIGFLCCCATGVAIILDFAYKYIRASTDEFLSPIVFIELVLLYYTVISPLILISNSDTYYGYKDMSPYISLSWCGCFVFYVSLMLGYKVALFPYFSVAFAKDTQDKVNLKNVFNIGAILVLLGLFLYMINGGYSLKQLFIGGVSESVELTSSFLSGYGKQMINFCIPGCCLMLIAYLQEKHSIYNRVLLVAAVTLSLSSFMIAGFRYRIIYLLMAFFTIYYIQKQKKPNLALWGLLFVILVLFMGVIGATRNYHKGLDSSQLQNQTISELMQKGMNDTRIFYATGALMNDVSSNSNFVYFTPIYTAVCMPIPRSIFRDKPDATYLVDMNVRIWGTAKYGIAFMCYGEAFYAFGWAGIILCGLLLGIFSRYVYSLYHTNDKSVSALLFLSTYNGFMYVVLTRGYFAQQVTIFFLIIVIPMLLYKGLMLLRI